MRQQDANRTDRKTLRKYNNKYKTNLKEKNN